MMQFDNVLMADNEKWLTNGECYCKEVTLGINDSPDNWSEVEEIPEPIIESLEEAMLEQIVGEA